MYIFANKKRDIFLSANCKETDNLNLALCFNSIEDALLFEDKFSNNITFLNYLYEFKNNELILVDI